MIDIIVSSSHLLIILTFIYIIWIGITKLFYSATINQRLSDLDTILNEVFINVYHTTIQPAEAIDEKEVDADYDSYIYKFIDIVYDILDIKTIVLYETYFNGTYGFKQYLAIRYNRYFMNIKFNTSLNLKDLNS